MIIEQRQRVATSEIQGKVALKIHLPEVVGIRVAKAQIGWLRLRIALHLETVAAQDGRDRTGGGQLGVTLKTK